MRSCQGNQCRRYFCLLLWNPLFHTSLCISMSDNCSAWSKWFIRASMIRVEVKLWTNIENEQEPEWIGDCYRDGLWLRPIVNTGWLECKHCRVVACCGKGKHCKQPLHCPGFRLCASGFCDTNQPEKPPWLLQNLKIRDCLQGSHSAPTAPGGTSGTALV